MIDLTTRDSAKRYRGPGTLVDIGGRHLHFYSMGQANTQGPTVILESGLANGALIWGLVQPQVATFAHVVAYDRAGYGWSDSVAQPYSPEQIVADLHTLLTASHLPGPYILVGHSFGGLLMRLFAYSYPEQVAGLVLLDPVSDRMFLRSPTAYRDWAKGLSRTFTSLLWAGRLGALRLLVWSGQTRLLPSLVTKQPKEWQQNLLAAGFLSGKNFQAALTELPLFAANTQKVDKALLLNIPMAVLTHGQPGIFSGLAPDRAREAEEIWQQLQRETAVLSPQGRLVVAEKSGHDIHIDQPEIVIEMIRQIAGS